MDTPRRWQLASAVTAVAGLGVGAALLIRPSTEPVDSIHLETVSSVATPSDVDESPFLQRADIVIPEVIEDAPVLTLDASATSAVSLASPADVDPPAQADGDPPAQADVDAPSPADPPEDVDTAAEARDTTPSPKPPPAPAASADSPADIDDAGSIDSN